MAVSMTISALSAKPGNRFDGALGGDLPFGLGGEEIVEQGA